MDDDILLQQIARKSEGWEKIFRTLHDRYAKLVKYKIKSYCCHSEKDMNISFIDDISQKSWENIVDKAHQYKHDHIPRSSVKAWICRIALNNTKDFLKSKKEGFWRGEVMSSLDDDTSSQFSPKLEAMDVGKAVEIEDCVEKEMKRFFARYKNCRSLVRMIAVEKLSIEELARFLNRREGAASQFLSYCRKKLEAFVDPCFDFELTKKDIKNECR